MSTLTQKQQPTAFNIRSLLLAEVFDSPELITALADYSTSREISPHSLPKQEFKSVLFLQISTAADYFSTNATLMTSVPPVKVDIST